MFWACLLTVAALVHPYILAMLALLWLSDLLGLLVTRQRPAKSSAREFIVISALIGFICWQAGYFMVSGDGLQRDYGYYRMNLLSLFDKVDGRTFYQTCQKLEVTMRVLVS